MFIWVINSAISNWKKVCCLGKKNQFFFLPKCSAPELLNLIFHQKRKNSLSNPPSTHHKNSINKKNKIKTINLHTLPPSTISLYTLTQKPHLSIYTRPNHHQSMDEESLKSLSMDYLNLLINGQAFSDVTFSLENGARLVHAHRCILAARSLFFRKFFCGPVESQSATSSLGSPRGAGGGVVIPVNSVGYEVFMLMLQFLYSGSTSVLPQKHEARASCNERGCWHTHCSAAIDLALDVLAAASAFGVDQLIMHTQKQLASIVEKASIEDVMRVLLASRKQEMHQLWSTCSHLVAKSGLPPEVLAKHLPIDIVGKIEELRFKSTLARRSPFLAHHHSLKLGGHSSNDIEDHQQKIHRMRRALNSSDVELVKLMVMGEGLNLDDALALHYAVENCSREVVKALLEPGAADVNCPAGPTGRTPLHIASEMVCPDMVAVLLDHHADPSIRTLDGVTPLDILRSLTSDFLFKGAVPGLTHIEPNKLRLCLELVQSAAMVMSREDAANSNASNSGGGGGGNMSLNLDSRMVYLNLGMVDHPHVQMDDDGGGGGGANSNRSHGGSGNIGGSSLYSPHHHFH